jgi:organic radical activating enzyme
MKEIIEIKNLNNEIFVYWVLTDFCNQHCSYCLPSLNNGTYANSPAAPSAQDIDLFIDKLIATKKRLTVCISGGEPTTHDQFNNIINRLHDYANVIVVTNGTRSVGWWRELSKHPHLVIISLHPEYYDAKKLKINQLCEFLSDNSVKLQFNLLCHPQKWNIVMSIVNDIDDRFKPFIIPKVIQDQGTFKKELYPYTREQLDFVKNYPTKLDTDFSWDVRAVYSDGTTINASPNSLMADGSHYYYNWKCSAGSEGISVAANGMVFAGVCSVKSLGHISNFKFLDEYLTCPRPSCICPGDIFLNKYNSKIVLK